MKYYDYISDEEKNLMLNIINFAHDKKIIDNPKYIFDESLSIYNHLKRKMDISYGKFNIKTRLRSISMAQSEHEDFEIIDVALAEVIYKAILKRITKSPLLLLHSKKILIVSSIMVMIGTYICVQGDPVISAIQALLLFVPSLLIVLFVVLRLLIDRKKNLRFLSVQINSTAKLESLRLIIFVIVMLVAYFN